MGDLSTGLELILNACEGVLQIAVSEDEKPLCYEEWFQSQRGSEILADALREICQRLNIKMKDFRRVGCFTGPGSFTGIRLVLATAAAIRRAGNAQLASLDYMQALAASAVMRRDVMYGGIIFAITHARRNLVHFQEFTSFGPAIPPQPAKPAELIEPVEALKRIASGRCYVCGSALERNPDIFAIPVTGQGPATAPDAILMKNLRHPDPAALLLLGRHGDYFPRDPDPKYIRGCDAMENEHEPGITKAVEEILSRQPKSEI